MQLPLSLRASRSRQQFQLDLVLVATTVLAAVIGVIMVYTATRGLLLSQGISTKYFLKRQAIFVVLGLAVMVVATFIDYRRLESFGMLIYGLSVFSLVVVLLPGIGKHTLGSQRWFSLGGGLTIQPSEFAVLGLIVGIATYCSRRTEGLAWKDVLKLLAMAGVPILLVFKQPDLGTAIIMTIVLLVMLAVAGLPTRILLLLVVAAVLVVIVGLQVGILHHYQLSRLTTFLHQDSTNPKVQNAVYNIQQAKDAIGAGGLFGTGLLHGAQTNLGYVPEQQTDFIFTAVGEQLGFVGATSVLLLLGVVGWRFLRAAQLARDTFGRILCAGIFAYLAYSVFQNAGMTMGIMPIAGIPLPFVSYGGSAAMCFFLATGVALSVYGRRNVRLA